MEKLNLYGTSRFPPNSTTPPRIYSTNIGDCGNILDTSNLLTSFYDTSVVNTNNNKNYLYYVSAASGGWSSRVLNFTQNSGQIFRDLGTVQQNGYNTLRVTVYPSNIVILYNQPPNIVYQTRYAVLNLTNFNNNSIMNVFAINTSINYLSPMTATGLGGTSLSTYTLFTYSSTEGTLTISANSANGRKYLYSVNIMISANFNAGASIILSIMMDTTTLYTETFYVDNTVHNYAINMIYAYSLTSSDVGKKIYSTIQYVGGTGMSLTGAGYYSAYFINREL